MGSGEPKYVFYKLFRLLFIKLKNLQLFTPTYFQGSGIGLLLQPFFTEKIIPEKRV